MGARGAGRERGAEEPEHVKPVARSPRTGGMSHGEPSLTRWVSGATRLSCRTLGITTTLVALALLNLAAPSTAQECPEHLEGA